MIGRLLANIRRRSAVRRAIVGLYDEGMCRHVRVVLAHSDADDDIVPQLMHLCGDSCRYLAARRIADEHLGAW